MKKLIIGIALVLAVSCTHAQFRIIKASDFGATANDNSNDDRKALQKCIDKAMHRKGTFILLEPGTYSYKGNLVLDFSNNPVRLKDTTAIPGQYDKMLFLFIAPKNAGEVTLAKADQ